MKKIFLLLMLTACNGNKRVSSIAPFVPGQAENGECGWVMVSETVTTQFVPRVRHFDRALFFCCPVSNRKPVCYQAKWEE